jgi:pimeloyl-ACP methyl ester carboxylesterase
VTPPARTFTWYPLTEKRWPAREWIGCVTDVDGVDVFARIAPTGDPDLPPVVMLHGLVVSSSYFRPIARHLDARVRLYIPDMPGFGRSGGDHVYDIPQLAAAVDRWMGVHGLERAVIVGNSLGCQVATALAVSFPQRVSRLVMVAPTVDPATGGPIGMMLRGLRDIPREQASLWRIWIPDFLLSGPKRALKTLMYLLRDPQESRLPSVRQPMVCVAGERDPVCPPAWVRRFADLVPDGRCIVIPNAAHAMNYSAPDAVGRVIIEVLEGGSRGVGCG